MRLIMNYQRPNQNFHCIDSKMRGFTLFELILVIVIMSGITIALAFSAQKAIDKINYERSQALVLTLKKAVDTFAQRVNRYPCPADPTLTPGDANYGKEDCAWAAANSEYASNRVTSTYPKLPVDMTLTANAGKNMVFIGALPSKVQGKGGVWVDLASFLPTKMDQVGSSILLDPSGKMPIYAVSKPLTDTSTGLSDYGNIQIVDENNNPVAGTNNDARYVIVAQTYRAATCLNTNRDFENCQTGTAANDTFMIAPRSLSESSGSFFDDVVVFNNSINDQRWLSEPTTALTSGTITGSSETRAVMYANKNARNIGVGTTTPTEKLEVNGTLRAETNVRAPLLCDAPTVETALGDGSDLTFPFPHIFLQQSELVVSTISGSVSTPKVLGTDYTITGNPKNGSGVVTFNAGNAPAAGDTVRIERGLCLDPLTLSKRFDGAGVYGTNNDALLCPDGSSISTSGLFAGLPPAGDSSWMNASTPNSVTGFGALNPSGVTPGDKTSTTRMDIRAPDSSSDGYWQLGFYRSPVTSSRGLYGMDRPGQKIILSVDSGDTHGAGNALNPQNAITFEIIGSKARYKYEKPSTGICDYSASSDIRLQQIAKDCKGFHTKCSGSVINGAVYNPDGCPYNSAMHTILVRPIGGTPTPQTNVNFNIQRVEQYLAGTKIGPDGQLQPICKNLEISNLKTRLTIGPVADRNKCPTGVKLRGIFTDGRAVCAND